MLIGNVVILSATKGERLCCISIMTECQTLGHDPMQQEMLRRPGACLCRARQTGPPLDDSFVPTCDGYISTRVIAKHVILSAAKNLPPISFEVLCRPFAKLRERHSIHA